MRNGEAKERKQCVRECGWVCVCAPNIRRVFHSALLFVRIFTQKRHWESINHLHLPLLSLSGLFLLSLHSILCTFFLISFYFAFFSLIHNNKNKQRKERLFKRNLLTRITHHIIAEKFCFIPFLGLFPPCLQPKRFWGFLPIL